MIKVTVGEQKTQSQKPFPKLMNCKDGAIYYFIRDGYGLPLANWNENRWESFKTLDACSWDMDQFTDYNEPITLQNP